MAKKQRLLEKYEIPVEHLDFIYVKNCTDVREVERMLEILQSGEEGYYPELTKCTEQRLQDLDPNHRMLRTEIQCQRTTQQYDAELITFLDQLKIKDHSLRSNVATTQNEFNGLPPIRSQGTTENGRHVSLAHEKIRSLDYDKWNKYDADTECLSIDLKEEKNRERCLRKEKLGQNSKKVTEILSTVALTQGISDTERCELAQRHRTRGNEYFKCADFAHALTEYTMSIGYLETVAAFNNRALTYLKLENYKEAIEDCDKCLALDHRNVKTMLRKCDGLVKLDRKNEAYQVYLNVLDIEPNNIVAKRAINATPIRLAIEDTNADQLSDEQTQHVHNMEVDECDDLQQLIIPRRIVPMKTFNLFRTKSK